MKQIYTLGKLLVLALTSIGLIQCAAQERSTQETTSTIDRSHEALGEERRQDSSKPISLSLSPLEYRVADTSKYASFRLYVKNTSDSIVLIDHVEPSCGCILTTIQKSKVVHGKDGEIYVSLTTERMSDDQPYLIEVYTSHNEHNPLRMYIRKE